MGKEGRKMFSREILSNLTSNEGKSREDLLQDMKGLTARLTLIHKRENRGALTAEERREKKELTDAIIRKKNAITMAKRGVTRAAWTPAGNRPGLSREARKYNRQYDLYDGV